MKRVRQSVPEAVVNDAPIFVGTVRSQDLVAEGDAALLRVTSVTFEDGARNQLHWHGADQVLFVTHGRGIVATEREELRVEPGDTILIPARERHWHGAERGHDFTHLSLLTPGAMETVE